MGILRGPLKIARIDPHRQHPRHPSQGEALGQMRNGLDPLVNFDALVIIRHQQSFGNDIFLNCRPLFFIAQRFQNNGS